MQADDSLDALSMLTARLAASPRSSLRGSPALPAAAASAVALSSISSPPSSDPSASGSLSSLSSLSPPYARRLIPPHPGVDPTASRSGTTGSTRQLVQLQAAVVPPVQQAPIQGPRWWSDANAPLLLRPTQSTPAMRSPPPAATGPALSLPVKGGDGAPSSSGAAQESSGSVPAASLAGAEGASPRATRGRSMISLAGSHIATGSVISSGASSPRHYSHPSDAL